MKPLLVLFLLCLSVLGAAQKLDYLSVRKSNGRVIKNFYAGSEIVLQTTENAYLQGPIRAVLHDTVFVTLYDVRMMPTVFGSFVRDTIAVSEAAVFYKDVKRIYLARRRNFWQRNAGSLLMIGGAGYVAVNVLNGAFYNQPLTDKRNTKILGLSVGAFGLGVLLKKVFASDGFTKKTHRIVYVNLSK